jgi:hypothetical protein
MLIDLSFVINLERGCNNGVVKILLFIETSFI